MRERLIELIAEAHDLEDVGIDSLDIDGYIADHLLENGVIVPPCKVGDTVYYFSHRPFNLSVLANTIYEAHVVRIVTTNLGTSLVIQIHNEYGVTEVPQISSFGKTVFLTKEEAERVLKGEPEQ